MKTTAGHSQTYKAIAKSGLFDREFYLRSNLEVARDCLDPLGHFLRSGWKQGKNPNPFFDTTWYVKKYPEVTKTGMNPLHHYIVNGWKKGCNPSLFFSVNLYLKEHPELIKTGCEPLLHFLHAQKTSPKEIDFTQGQSKFKETNDVGKVAVHAHLYYPDLAGEFADYINYVPAPFDCFFTTDTPQKRTEILEAIGDNLKAEKFEIRVTPNVGRDIAPFVVGCRDLLVNYDYVCHIHSKKALHTIQNDYGNTWRNNMLDQLLGYPGLIRRILNYFGDHQDVGFLYPKNFIPIEYRWMMDINKWNMEYLIKRMGLKIFLPFRIDCAVGSMFWVRTKAFAKLYEAEFSYSEFDNEVGQLDGALAHAFERIFVYIAQDAGFSSRIIGNQNIEGCRV